MRNLCLAFCGFLLSACGGSGSSVNPLVELDPQTISLTGTPEMVIAAVPGSSATDIALPGFVGTVDPLPSRDRLGYTSSIGFLDEIELLTREEQGLSVALFMRDEFSGPDLINSTIARTAPSVQRVTGDAIFNGEALAVRTDTRFNELFTLSFTTADAELIFDFEAATVRGELTNIVGRDRNSTLIIRTEPGVISLEETTIDPDGTFSGRLSSSFGNGRFDGLLGGSGGSAAAITFDRETTDYREEGTAILLD